jgi:hypothetical protein
LKKNTAGQVVCFQMNSAADGSAVTSGTPTVYVLGDGGTQGSGGGSATHEGNGCWSYAPTQAETNYDHVAFTMVLSGAITQTVQVYPAYPQTGDSYARLGAPAGASVSADIATVDGNVDSILDDTGTSGVIVATNNDKTGYTASTVSDKTGYSISGTKQTLDALNDIDGSSVTATTVSDKTGYALSAAGVQAIWDALTSALTTVGSVGKKLADWILGTDSKALVSTDAQDLSGTLDVNAKTVGDKAGYSISGTKTTLDALNDLAQSDILSDATAFAGASIAAIKAQTDNLPDGVKKNAALSNFMFLMVDSTDHVTPKTGLTVTATRSIDGAAFGACANSASELSNGVYKIDLAAADLNGDVITLRFTASGADDRLITVKTNS